MIIQTKSKKLCQIDYWYASKSERENLFNSVQFREFPRSSTRMILLVMLSFTSCKNFNQETGSFLTDSGDEINNYANKLFKIWIDW